VTGKEANRVRTTRRILIVGRGSFTSRFRELVATAEEHGSTRINGVRL
jgi:hypothetical protein